MKRFISENPTYKDGLIFCPECKKGTCYYSYSDAYVAAYIDITIAGTEFEIYICNNCGAEVNNVVNHTADYGIEKGWGIL